MATTTATLFESVRDEVSSLDKELEPRAERGTPRREFLNGLLRDLFVVQQLSLAEPKRFDDVAFVEPFAEQFLAKLALVPALFPELAEKARATQDRVRAQVSDRSAFSQAREIARPLFENGALGRLHADARAHVEAAHLTDVFMGEGTVRSRPGSGPAELACVARLCEALALHAAHAIGAGGDLPAAGTPEHLPWKILGELEAWLESRGASADRPEIGSLPQKGERAPRAVPGKKPVVGAPRGAVALVVGCGFAFQGRPLSRPTVVLSAGAQAHTVGAVNAVLAKAEAAVLRRTLPTFRSLEANARRLFDDPESKTNEKAAACLNMVEALHPLGLLADPAVVAHLVEAIESDFAGEKVDLLVPSSGQPSPAGYPAEVREVWSYEVPPGTVVEVAGLGVRLGGQVVRKPVLLVSKGPPPAGAVDEITQLLPEGELGAAYKDRLKRSRTRDDELARALAELVIEGRHEDLLNASQRAMRALVDAPPAALSDVAGWQELHDFLEKNLDALIEDGQEGQRTAHRLLRPYLQTLASGREGDPRLRSIAESLTAILGLYGEDVTQATRAYFFSELSKLRADSLQDSSHSRRLARSIAHGMRLVAVGDNPSAMRDLVTSLGQAGIKVYPTDGERLGLCPEVKDLFHRLELRYDDAAPRGKILGAFDAAVIVGQSRETGGIALSLGKAPKLLELVKSDALQNSRLRPAIAKIEAKVIELERTRLTAELQGDATADRVFAREMATFLAQLLKEVGWSRNEQDRESLGQLFQVLKDDWKLELLPAYLTYRELRKLTETHGEKVKVEVKEATSREVVLEKIGAIFRDEVLEPLNMVWKVGKAPPYIAHLKKIDWFAAVLDGKESPLKMGPKVTEAILDFMSPDSGSVEGIVRSLQIIATWLAAEHAARLDQFLDVVKQAPGLELDFFPLPGKVYTREVILKAVNESKAPGNLAVAIDAAKSDGEATLVQEIAVYREGRRLSDEPKATFALKTSSPQYDGYARALEPLLKSGDVSPYTKRELDGLKTKIALLQPGPATQAIEIEAFRVLFRAHLIDPQYPLETQSAVHKLGAYLTGTLSKAGVLKVERFENVRQEKELKAPEKGLVISEEFCTPGMPEILAVERPLVLLGNELIQAAFARKGVPTDEAEVVELDRVLNDAAIRLRAYSEGSGAVVLPSLDDKSQTILPRTIKRLDEVRGKMLEQHKAGKKAAPSKTSIRDLIMFLVDQIHRHDDALALLEDRTHRAAFSDQVFKDVIFRSCGPFLSRTHGISIDTAVVAGADISVLTGKFKKETTGPKPKRVNNLIFSVVVPAFNQGGTCIRPATVRCGEF
jgi:hypothetical protein